MQDEVIRVAEWGSVGGKYELTDAQRARQARGKPIYERDRSVALYKVSKGKWV